MASSKFTIKHTQPKRGDIKIQIIKMFVKSLQKLANWVAGKHEKAAGKRKEAVGDDVMKKNRPRRGQIKEKIFKMGFNSIKDLGNGVFMGKKKKAAGNSGFTSPATVIPVENVGEMKSEPGGEKYQIEIKIRKTIGGSVIEFLDSGRKKKRAVVRGRIPMAGVLPVEL